jgi:hypothetical protein
LTFFSFFSFFWLLVITRAVSLILIPSTFLTLLNERYYRSKIWWLPWYSLWHNKMRLDDRTSNAQNTINPEAKKIKILETRRNFEPYSTLSRTAGANALIGYAKHTTEKPDSHLHIFVWTQADKSNSCDQLFCFEETVDVFSRNALAVKVKGIKQSFRAIARWHHIAIQWSLLQSSNKLNSIIPGFRNFENNSISSFELGF